MDKQSIIYRDGIEEMGDSIRVTELEPGVILASGKTVKSVETVNRIWGGTMVKVEMTDGSSGVVGPGVKVLVR